MIDKNQVIKLNNVTPKLYIYIYIEREREREREFHVITKVKTEYYNSSKFIGCGP